MIFELSPVRIATEEVLAKGDESHQVRNNIGRKMVELSTIEIEERTEEWVRGQRETSLDVGREEHPLVPLRRGLNFARLRRSLAPRDQEP